MGGHMDEGLLDRFANMQLQNLGSGAGTIDFRKFIELYSNLKLGKVN